MSLYLYTRPLENSLFDVFDDDFFNTLTPKRAFGHPCRTRCHRIRSHRRDPYPSLGKQLSKFFNEDNHLELVDFAPKINLSEVEKNYYIHADLPGLNKDQVKMELSEDRILTISGERKYTYNNNNESTEKEKEEEKAKENENENEMETEQTEQNEKTEQENTAQKENEMETEKDDKVFSVQECSYGSFSRSFSIPEDADIENIQAKMENGVLEVIFKKIEPPKPQNRSIQIQ